MNLQKNFQQVLIKRRRITIYKIHISNRAQYNFFQIKYYIQYKLQNIIAAKRIGNSLINKIYSLEFLPYRGKVYNSNNTNIRYLIHKKYLIFYKYICYVRIKLLKKEKRGNLIMKSAVSLAGVHTHTHTDSSLIEYKKIKKHKTVSLCVFLQCKNIY